MACLSLHIPSLRLSSILIRPTSKVLIVLSSECLGMKPWSSVGGCLCAQGRHYRLPSEAEWEYACRAGTVTPFHFGTTLTPDLANYDGRYPYGNGPRGQYRQQTTSVGSFCSECLGLHDMHGNIWEWCMDHWHQNYEDAPQDGSAWLSNKETARRVRRGGSWFNYPWRCRAACRYGFDPYDRYKDIGFRLSCSLPRTP